MAGDPKRAVSQIAGMLRSLENLPRSLSNKGELAKDRLGDFTRWAASQPASKASFKAALADIHDITKEVTRIRKEAGQERFQPGSWSSEQYYNALRTEKQGRKLEGFERSRKKASA